MISSRPQATILGHRFLCTECISWLASDTAACAAVAAEGGLSKLRWYTENEIGFDNNLDEITDIGCFGSVGLICGSVSSITAVEGREGEVRRMRHRTSYIWNGGEVAGPRFVSVTAEVVIPNITFPYGYNSSAYYSSSVWVGIGGDANTCDNPKLINHRGLI